MCLFFLALVVFIFAGELFIQNNPKALSKWRCQKQDFA